MKDSPASTTWSRGILERPFLPNSSIHILFYYNKPVKSAVGFITKLHQQISSSILFHNLLQNRLGILILPMTNYFCNYLVSQTFSYK